MALFKRKVRNKRDKKKEVTGDKAKLNLKNTAKPASKLSSKLSNVNWGILRIQVVAVGFVLFWVALWGRAWYWQIIEGSHLADQAKSQHIASVLVTGKRGNITDRHGQVLARSVESLSVFARPHEVEDVEATATTLATILELPVEKVYAQLSNDARKFIWISRKVDDHTAQVVRSAGLAGIGLSKEYERVYPFKHMAGQLLGFVGVDDQGLEGLERSFDKHLASTSTRQLVQRDARGRRFFLHSEGQKEPTGRDLQLTIDTQVQFFAEDAVAKTVEKYDAAWGGVMVVDVETGDIMAWAQYPFFNPNAFGSYAPSQYRNRLAFDALEPGSTIKPFLVAAALQEKTVTKDSIFDCEGGKWQTQGITIRDTSTRDNLTVEEIIRYSSNIGVAKIGEIMGAPTYHKYLSELGFGERTVLPVSEGKGILRAPKNWRGVDLLNAAFGQGFSTTALQMAQAYLTLLNDGVYKPLRLIKNYEQEDMPRPHRVFSADVTNQVIKMMRDVVHEDGGSGKRARIEGIDVGGKTGTAQKADKKTGTYGDGRMASFVGFAPAENPKYLTLVMVDEPKNVSYGGIVAAPVFQQVTRLAMTYGGDLPDIVFADSSNVPLLRRGSMLGKNARKFKLSSSPSPMFSAISKENVRRTVYNTLPGHMTKASSVVPNVVGKTVRTAVELFARGGIVPVLKGDGQRVVRQEPKPGSQWPEDASGQYVLWLSEI